MLTSVHPRYDIRIFLKECNSLFVAGYKVSLIVADGKGDEVKDNVIIYDVGTARGRVGRIMQIPGRIFKKAKVVDADIYHLHDPELIPVGLKLKGLGKKVIFDSHEDVPTQMLPKSYLNKPTRWVIAQMLLVYEKWACKRFDGIVGATPYIRDKFLRINSRSVDINNFPIPGELISSDNDFSNKKKCICYIGDIAIIRGIKEMVKAMECVDDGVKLVLAGTFGESDAEMEVKKYSGWANVDELGWLNRDGVRSVLAQSLAGLVTLHPVVNYLDSLPVKMFEYMSAGIPVIASNFPLWREIIEGNNCGICIDPLNPQKIADSVNKLVNNSHLAAIMGSNGRKAVEKYYNWHNEEQKLLDLYKEIL